jgi:Flp pilus assembly protein TadD
MIKPPVVLALALALATAPALTGCDRSARLTEQEHIQRAKDFEDKGDVRGSIIELKNAIQKNPDSPQARMLLGQVYLKAGSGAEAEKELLRAQQLGISRDSLAPQLGEALLLMGEYQRLLDEIQTTESSRPSIRRASLPCARMPCSRRARYARPAICSRMRRLSTPATRPPTGGSQCAQSANGISPKPDRCSMTP